MKPQLSDLDYFMTKDGIIFLVKGDYHPPGRVFAYPVFWPDRKGERHNPELGRYSKHVSDTNNQRIFEMKPEYRHIDIPQATPLVPETDVIRVFEPQQRLADFIMSEEEGMWHQLYNSLKYFGIPPQDIGIFGSYLVGLHGNQHGEHLKDIDFVIYGLENMRRVKAAITSLRERLNANPISPDHIKYHAYKFGRCFSPDLNSFNLTLANKWSSLQLAPGLLSTLRFSYKKSELPTNPISGRPLGLIQLKGKVVTDEGTNFMPRTFGLITSRSEIWQVVTYFWGFQSAVKIGDEIKVSGQLHTGNVISVDAGDHGIKILDSARAFTDSKTSKFGVESIFVD